MNPSPEQVAKDIVARFDDDQEIVKGCYFYDPLREWIATAISNAVEDERQRCWDEYNKIYGGEQRARSKKEVRG